jgi:hypothetical protein
VDTTQDMIPTRKWAQRSTKTCHKSTKKTAPISRSKRESPRVAWRHYRGDSVLYRGLG